MMMASPIPDSFWKNVFHATVALGTAATVHSLWRQRQASRAEVTDPLKALSAGGVSPAAVQDALRDIKYAVDQQHVSRKGAGTLALYANAGALVAHLELNPEAVEESIATLTLVIEIIRKSFAASPPGRDAFAAAGGCEALLGVIARAHKLGHDGLAKDCVAVLGLVTAVDESGVVLPTDVPEGSMGALALAACPATPKMLRLLSPDTDVAFLTACLKVFANVASLRAGALALRAGIDGVTAFSIFMRYLGPGGNQMLSEQAARAIQWLVMHCSPPPAEVVDADTVATLVATAVTSPTAEVACCMLELFGSVMIDRGDERFIEAFITAGGFNALVRLWCTHPDRKCRVTAESVVCALADNKDCAPAVADVMAANQMMLRERRQKDEMELREHQQRQQQQQRMMMQMMGGGAPDMM